MLELKESQLPSGSWYSMLFSSSFSPVSSSFPEQEVIIRQPENRQSRNLSIIMLQLNELPGTRKKHLSVAQSLPDFPQCCVGNFTSFGFAFLQLFVQLRKVADVEIIHLPFLRELVDNQFKKLLLGMAVAVITC